MEYQCGFFNNEYIYKSITYTWSILSIVGVNTFLIILGWSRRFWLFQWELGQLQLLAIQNILYCTVCVRYTWSILYKYYMCTFMWCLVCSTINPPIPLMLKAPFGRRLVNVNDGNEPIQLKRTFVNGNKQKVTGNEQFKCKKT